MPKQNKGKIIDIDNLEQAKRILSDIVSLTEKQYEYTTNSVKQQKIVEQQMADKDKVISLFKQLENVMGKSLSKYKISINSVMKDLHSIATDIGSDINKQINDKVKAQAQYNLAVEKEMEQAKEIERIDKNREKLLTKKNSLEIEANKIAKEHLKDIKKIAEKEYDNMSKVEQIKHGGKEKYTKARTKELNTEYVKEYNTLIDKNINDAFESGSEFTSKDLKNLSDSAFGKVTESTEEFTKSLDKFNLGSAALEVGAKALKAGLDTAIKLFKSGIEKQTTLYENTFENISVRTGISDNTYRQQQRDTASQLSSMGMYDNIKVSEVQEMWDSLAKTGMNESDMFASAIDNVITQKIVPYLDTTSKSFNILNNRLDGKFVKDIRGINQANLDLAGNNYATQDMLQQIIDEVQPMSDEAMNNLAQSSTEVTSMVNSLIQKGYSEDAAKSYATQVFKAKNYGDQVMRSGSTSEKYTMISAIDNGVNVYDPTQWDDYMGLAVNTTQMLNSIGPGYTDTASGIVQGSLATATGESYDRFMGAQKLQDKRLSGTDIQKSIDKQLKEKGGSSAYANNVTTKFADGENQTAKQKQDTQIENKATDVAYIKEYLGEWSVIVESLISGIGGLFTTWIGGKLIGGVVGKSLGILGGSAAGGSGAGIGAALSANGLAFGAFGAAAGIALTGIISDGIINSEAKNMGKNVDYYDKTGKLDKFKKYDENGNEIGMSDTAKKLLSGGLDDAGTKGWGGNISDSLNFIGEYKSNPLMGWGISKEDRNKAIFAKEMNLIGAQNLSDIDTAKARTAWLLIADASGVLDDLDGWSRDGLKSAYTTIFNGDDDALYWVNKIKSWGNFYNPQMSTDAGKTTTYISPDKDWLSANYHRQGLDEVPYDGYKAVLHEGEAVLTSGTANEMRDLVDEYRDTNDQKANFQVVIESQTISILAKMDEIIEAITSSKGGTVQKTAQQQYQSNKSSNIKNSMINLRSSRQFG